MLEVKGVHARLGTLSEFNYRMSEEDIRLSWRTMDYPTVRIGLHRYSPLLVFLLTLRYTEHDGSEHAQYPMNSGACRHKLPAIKTFHVLHMYVYVQAGLARTR